MGCLSAGRLPWSGVRELRFMAVDPSARTRGIGVNLYYSAIREALAQDDCEVLFARTRQRATTRFGEDPSILPMTVTGHDGGVEFANGSHETHLFMSAVNPWTMPQRATLDPSEPGAALYDEVAWTCRPAERPAPALDAFVVAPQPRRWWTDGFAHLRQGRNADLPPIGGCSRRRALAEAERLVNRHIRAGVRHVSAVVPATQVEFARDLGELGFTPTAYLPAWYADGDVRHDCVLLTRVTGPVSTNGQDGHIDRWDALLQGFISASRRR
ncbi:MAG: hypothetical protein JWM47_3661 [Acidimicrobiales bacterium]|nr:hypothetical protein [Acidimicrobiales bacterium]